MSRTPKVSIIVPIYNVEKYIGRCLMSIKKQSFKDFEVLLINDGTPDNSMRIAEKFANADKRFVIYNKENGGLSDARNYGIDRAVGDYIVFIDSDDYIDSDYVRALYNECVINNADISCCRYNMYFTDKFIIPIPVGRKKSVIDRDTCLDVLIRDNNMQSFAWNKMYKRSLFSETGIRYPVMYFEDVATSPRVVYNAEKIAISDIYLYNYVKRGGSILSTMNSKKINDYIRSYYIIRDYLEKQGAFERFRGSLRFVSAKVELINIYSVLREHIIARNFKDAGKNLGKNHKLFKIVNAKGFKAEVDDAGMAKLPFEISQPEKCEGKCPLKKLREQL